MPVVFKKTPTKNRPNQNCDKPGWAWQHQLHYQYSVRLLSFSRVCFLPLLRKLLIKSANTKKNPTEAIRAIERKFNVPHPTLNGHVRGKRKTSIGRRPILSAEEEGAIMNWIIQMSDYGFPVTRTRTIQKAQQMVNYKMKAQHIRCVNGFQTTWGDCNK